MEENDANQTRIVDAGGAEAVVTAMRQHADVADVQEEACVALGSMLTNNARNQTRIGDAGGIEALVAAMQRHADTIRVQKWACIALATLFNVNAANETRICAAGGIEAVVAAIQRLADAGDEWAVEKLLRVEPTLHRAGVLAPREP